MLPALNPAYKTVIDVMQTGETVVTSCQKAGVSVAAFYAAKRRSPELQSAFEAAQEIQLDVMADDIFNIHVRVRDPLMARVVSENRRWLLGKRNPLKFGEKMPIDDARNADLTAILREAVARIPRPVSDQPQTIDAEKVTISDIFGE
jgi:hypothetical protein